MDRTNTLSFVMSLITLIACNICVQNNIQIREEKIDLFNI